MRVLFIGDIVTDQEKDASKALAQGEKHYGP